MFIGTFVSLTLAFLYFGLLYPFGFNPVVSAFVIACLVTVVEGITPKGLDNVAVPFVGAVTFILLKGGV